MPISATIDHDKRFVTVQASGHIVLQDVFDYFDRLVTEGAMPYAKLVDARAAEPALSDDDVLMIKARISAYAVYDPRGPIAVVVSEETRDLVRRLLNIDAARPAMLFTSSLAARRWLQG